MKKQFFAKLFLALIFNIPFATYASFTITPVELEVSKDKKTSTLTIANNNEEEKSFQLVAYKTETENGKETTYKETKDLIITPVVFKVAAGKSQLVRIAINDNVMYNSNPRGYTLAVQELPHTVVKEGSHVQMVTKFTVPVSIK